MKKSKTKIAILGATSHIAKGLIFFLKDEKLIELYLYARNFEKVNIFLRLIDNENLLVKPISSLTNDKVDFIINCIGIGNNFSSHDNNVFELTENFDQICINYLRANNNVTYINFSSGAVYGTSFAKPACRNSITSFTVNNIGKEDYYRIAKLNCEAKHRLLNSLRIIDFRLFGYYSRFIDLNENYLLCDIILSIKENRLFKTSPLNLVRDYVHPSDLANILKLCIELDISNQVFDIMSLKPISKMEILEFFALNYGLKYEVTEHFSERSSTGEKLNYYSENINNELFDFTPRYTSIESIKIETEALFNMLV